MKLKFHYLPLICLLFSCDGTKHNLVSENGSLLINLSPESAHLPVSDAIQVTKVINLETTDNSTISSDRNIKRILVDDGKLYVMDGRYMSIKVFDGNGKYLHSIGSLGIRHGQFTNLQDIAFYPHHHSLWALSNSPSKVIEFSLDGKILNEIPIPFYASSLGFASDNKVWFFINQNRSDASGDKNMLITDSSLNIKERLFNLPLKFTSSVLFAGGIYTIGNDLYFNPGFSRTIYSLKNDSARAVYSIDFAEQNGPADFALDSLTSYLSHRSLLTQNFVKQDGYVGFSYQNKGNHMLSFFDTKTKRLLTTDAKLNPFDSVFNNSIFQSGGQLMMLCNSDKFIGILKNSKGAFKQKYPLLYAKLMQRKAHDNPTILFFTLK